MDNKQLLKYFKLIGDIKSKVSQSSSLEEAIHNGLNCLADSTDPDYAIIWIKEKNEASISPIYWIGPHDFTYCKRDIENSVVGEVSNTLKTICCLKYSKGFDTDLEKDITGGKISSMICAPLSTEQDIGCIQIVLTNGKHFDGEIVDICEILILLIAMTINETFMLKDA